MAHPEYPTGAGSDDPSSQATPVRPDELVSHVPSGANAPSYGAANPLDRAQVQSRFVAPTEETQTLRRPINWRAVVAGMVAAVVLAISASWVYVTFVRQPVADPGVEVSVSGPESKQAAIPRPDLAVRGYLEALADGDVEKAITFGGLGQGSRKLLTNEAYAATFTVSPIANVTVAEQDPNATQIRASYTVAGQPQEATFRVTKQPDGNYLLDRTTVTVRLEMLKADRVPVFINGVQISDQQTRTDLLEVVPGIYTPSTKLPYLAFPSSTAFPILSLEYADVAAQTLAPEITDEGIIELRKAAGASLRACFERTELKPADCPQALNAGGATVTSLKWILKGEPWAQANATLSRDDETVATMVLHVSYSYEATLADGTTSGTPSLEATYTLIASLLATNPGELQVLWR